MRYSILTLIALIFCSISVTAQSKIASLKGDKKSIEFFLSHEMQYPQDELDRVFGGDVQFQFVVDKTGEVSQIEILDEVSKDIDKEALRLFKKMEWNPATDIRGQAISSKAKYQIAFNPKKYKRFCKKRGYAGFQDFNVEFDTNFRIYTFRELDQIPSPYTAEQQDVMTFLMKNMNYPEGAKQQGVGGDVVLSFVIEPSGNISNLVAKKEVGAGCTEEAVRLFKQLKWNAGEKAGAKVRTAASFSIRFNAEDGSFQYAPASMTN